MLGSRVILASILALDGNHFIYNEYLGCPIWASVVGANTCNRTPSSLAYMSLIVHIIFSKCLKLANVRLAAVWL